MPPSPSLTCYLSKLSFELALYTLALYCGCKLIWMLLCCVDNEDINLLLRRQESISFLSHGRWLLACGPF